MKLNEFGQVEVIIWSRYEGEEQKRGAISSREGKCRIYGTGQDVATSVGHHVATGQSLRHPTDHLLPENAPRLPRR